MLEYLHTNNFTSAYNALKEEDSVEYTPDPKAKYVSRIDRFSLGPIGGGFQGGRDGSRGEQGSSQRY